MAGAAASAIAQFLLVVIVTNFFTVTAAGILFAATSLILILTAVASLGTDTGLARFILRFEALGRVGDIRTLLHAAGRPVALLSLAIGLTVFLLADRLAPLISLGEEGGQLLRILAFAVPAIALSDFALAGTRAYGRMRTTVLVDKFFRSLLQPMLILLAAAFGGGILLMAAAWAIPYVASCIMAGLLFHTLLRKRGALHKELAKSPPGLIWREFWSFTWARGITRFMQIVLQRADIILIGAILGPTEAAVYTAATRFVVLGQFMVQAIQNVLQPRFSDLLARDQNRVVRDLLRTVTTWNIALIGPIYAAAALGAPLYMRIFGPEYAQSVGAELVVMLMALAMAFAAAAGPLDTLLVMSGRSLASLLNMTTAVVLNIALCLLLIPALGFFGAAVAWAAAIVVRNLFAYLQVRRWLDMTPQSLNSGLVIGAIVACYVIPLAGLRLTAAFSLTTAAIALLLGSGLYVSALYVLRRRLALSAFRAVVRRRSTPSL